MFARENQGPIQREPDGLLSFLDLKGQGASPNSLRGDVQGTLDLLPFFLGRPPRVATGGGTLTASGSSNFLAGTFPAVPPTELWFITDCSAFVTLGAASVLRSLGVSLGLIPAPPTLGDIVDITAYADVGPFTGLVGETVRCNSKRNFIMRPNQQLGASFQGYQHAANSTVVLTATYLRLQL